MLKKLTLAISAATALSFSGLSTAENFDTALGKFDVSMGVTLASDYIWRGQSQTAGSGAVQGSLNIEHESGFYLGTWASNIDSDAFAGSDIEIDYYVGYGNSITEDISYDVQVARYTYPDASDLNSYELIPSISAYGFTAGVKWGFDRADDEHTLYQFVSYNYELPYEIGLSASYGHTDGKSGGKDGEYNDWSVGVSKTLLGLDVALTYTDTDISGSSCEDWYGDKDSCDTNVTLAVSKTF
jgi:uncharacterized protein (TIGR02001 family)